MYIAILPGRSSLCLTNDNCGDCVDCEDCGDCENCGDCEDESHDTSH